MFLKCSKNKISSIKGVMVDGKSTLSSSLKKDSYVEVVARKPWKGFKISGQITKPKKATVEEKRMKR